MRHTTFQYRLDPTPAMERTLRRHIGAARFAFNQCLRLHLNARLAGSGHVPWSRFDLVNAFNAWKRTEAAGRRFHVTSGGDAQVEVTGLRWRDQVCQQVFEEAAVDVGRALGAWTDSRRGKRRGTKVGHPRFKRKMDSSGSFRIRDRSGSRAGRPAIRVGEGHPRSISLPAVGTIRVFDDTRPLRRLISSRRGKILFATIRLTPAGRWIVSLNVAAAELHPARRHDSETAGPWVGVDRGLTALVLAATNTGQEVLRAVAPKVLTAGLWKQRQLAKRVSRKQKRSANRRKALRQLARHHERVVNRRNHFTHQLSNRLVKTHDRLCIEDLNVAGMLQNTRLARHIVDAAWATLSDQLVYKQAWAGGQLVQADPWFPSTQTCSACGVKRSLTLADRVFRCGACGHTADRDLNAAVNLAAWAETHAQAPERQTAARDTNAHREARSDLRSHADEPSLDEVGTRNNAAVAA